MRLLLLAGWWAVVAGIGVAPARGVDTVLDCGIRSLARDFASYLFPHDPAPVELVFDALRLGAECGEPPPLAALPGMRARHPRAAVRDAPTLYVSPSGSDASGDGSSAMPFATLPRALRASRGGATPARILLRGGTYYLDAPVVLTAADSGVSLEAAPGEAPVLSGGAVLTGLSWSSVRPGPPAGMSGPFPGVSVVSNTPGLTPGGNVTGSIVFLGTLASVDSCVAAALALTSPARATSYTYHDTTVTGGWAGQCFARVDGQWEPAGGFAGHFSGQYTEGVNGSVWRAALPRGAPFLNLFDAATGRRLVRAKAPNGNPETTINGFAAGAIAWGAPRAYPPPQNVVVQSPSRGDDPFFPTFQMGVGGTCEQFDPAEGFWCSTDPPAGSQYKVPSSVALPVGLFPGTWEGAAANGAIFHAFHGARWGNWAFQVAAANATSGNVSWEWGGFQEARGWTAGDTFMMEGMLDFLDDYGEWHVDLTENALYVMFNATAPPSAATALIATRLDSLLRLEGSADAPVVNVSLSGLTFTQTAPTYMKPSTMCSGGDWSVRRDAALWLEGTAGASVEGCNFVGLGGNAVFLHAFNRDASVVDSRFRFLGDSAIVSLGVVAGIDGTAQNVPARTTVRGNVMSELGLYTKQSGAYYHALSINATVVGNAMFNMPRAGINVNDGYGGGNVIASNLCFNAVRETSDHGCFVRAPRP